MKKYIYTTLAVGLDYLDKALKFSHDLLDKDPDCQRVIVTDLSVDKKPLNTEIISLEDNTTLRVCNTFNYNLKYQAIKKAIDFNTDYIIYTDADWRIHNQYDKSKFDDFFNHNQLDFYFERPHLVGAGKTDNWSCFWKHKIQPYNLDKISKYDNAHVCNEQFFILKNNDKLSVFVNEWEKRNQFCIDNNIWTFAEGLEIGMCSIDADMSFSWHELRSLSNCFEFNDISGNLHIRF